LCALCSQFSSKAAAAAAYTPHLRFCKLFRSKKSRLVVRAVHRAQRLGLTKAGIFKNERIKKAICTERTEAKQPCACSATLLITRSRTRAVCFVAPLSTRSTLGFLKTGRKIKESSFHAE